MRRQYKSPYKAKQARAEFFDMAGYIIAAVCASAWFAGFFMAVNGGLQ